MKKCAKEKLKIVNSAVTLLLSFFALFSVTLAWFSLNDSASGGGMDVTVDVNENVYGAEFFYVKKGGDGKTFVPFADGETPRMPEYNLLEENNYQIMVKVNLANDIDIVKITAKTQTEYYLGDGNHPMLKPSTADANVPDKTGADYTNALTSVCSFKALKKAELSKNADGSYSYTGESLDGTDRFIINATDKTAIPETEIFVREASDSDVVSTAQDVYNGAPCKSVYILITYDEELITEVFSLNIGNDNVYNYDAQGNLIGIPFECDFEFLFTPVA